MANQDRYSSPHLSLSASVCFAKGREPLFQGKMVMLGLERLMGSLKSKFKSMKVKKPYDKMEKTDSMRVEIRSRKARKLIEETLKVADSPKVRSYAF
ncbi:hypothetical protein MLD38_001251 [Melastoma candidum]|uniref:Uncharacterized protein n=1 Tax=Melastoma candidum TaxID=119954 RepID=A0ACB9SFY8_9MYRT|nr:hypothetical protein MLD38_001251 [Melastoma candidum]